MPIEAHLHHDPFWSMVVVCGVDLAVPLRLALGFVVGGSAKLVHGRRDGYDGSMESEDERSEGVLALPAESNTPWLVSRP